MVETAKLDGEEGANNKLIRHCSVLEFRRACAVYRPDVNTISSQSSDNLAAVLRAARRLAGFAQKAYIHSSATGPSGKIVVLIANVV